MAKVEIFILLEGALKMQVGWQGAGGVAGCRWGGRVQVGWQGVDGEV